MGLGLGLGCPYLRRPQRRRHAQRREPQQGLLRVRFWVRVRIRVRVGVRMGPVVSGKGQG